jgi:hypothetical protein
MGDGRTRFSAAVRRIEVHAGPNPDAIDETHWQVHGHPLEEKILLIGYLRRTGEEGFGQAQVVGLLDDCAWTDISSSDEELNRFAEWVELHFVETLYDNARRALQGQAALMDFQLALDIKAPPISLVLSDEDQDDIDD